MTMMKMSHDGDEPIMVVMATMTIGATAVVVSSIWWQGGEGEMMAIMAMILEAVRALNNTFSLFCSSVIMYAGKKWRR